MAYTTPTILPVRDTNVRPGLPIMETTDASTPQDDIAAIVMKMHALYRADNKVEAEMGTFGPIVDYHATNPMFEFAIIDDGSDREITVSGTSENVDVTVNIYGDGGGSDTDSASIVSTTTASRWETTVDPSGLTITNYIYGEIIINRNSANPTRTWGIEIKRGNTTIASSGAGGMIPIDDSATRGGDDQLDYFLIRRIRDNANALRKMNASRAGKLYNVLNPNGEDEGTTSTYVVGSTKWRLDGPYMFVSSPDEQVAKVLIRCEDGDAGAGAQFAEDYEIAVLGDGQSMVDVFNGEVSTQTVGSSGDQYKLFTGVPLSSTGVTFIYIAFRCDVESGSGVEITWSSGDAGNPLSVLMGAFGLTNASNSDYTGGKETNYCMPQKWVLGIKKSSNDYEGNTPYDDNRPEQLYDVAWFQESDAAGTDEGIKVSPPPEYQGISFGNEFTSSTSYMQGLTFTKYERNWLQIKSVHVLAVPDEMPLAPAPHSRPSAAKTMEMFLDINRISSVTAQCGLRHNGSFGTARDHSTALNAQVAPDYHMYGPWHTTQINYWSGGYTPTPQTHAMWYFGSLPTGHLQSPSVDYEEVPRYMRAKIFCAAFSRFLPQDGLWELELELCYTTIARIELGINTPLYTGDDPVIVQFGQQSIVTLTHLYAGVGAFDSPHGIVKADIAQTADMIGKSIALGGSLIRVKPAWMMQQFIADGRANPDEWLVASPEMTFDLTQLGALEFPGFFFVRAKQHPGSAGHEDFSLVTFGGYLKMGGRATV